ncbi:MAG: hypothetical protein M3P51_09640 [Chloroflexota bacterium]|nr:hypothetical protein [Chloroflexota bacterium]
MEFKPNQRYDHAFAIIRVDTFHDLSVATDLRDAITVKAIVNSEERAQAEVERLNALNEDKGSVYFWQVTRLERT